MAKKKQAAKGPKTFPKEQGDDTRGDRFVPPDRQDRLVAGDDDEPAQTINVRDLGADVEVLERDELDARPSADDEDDGEAEAADRRQARARTDDDDDQVQDGRRLSDESRRVRARVNRERTLREQAEAKVANAERRAKSVEDRLAKLERVTVEVQDNSNVKALEAKIGSLEKQIADALEADETKKAFGLQVELGDAKADLKLLKRDLESARKQQITDEAARRDADAGEATTESTGESATTVDWKNANRGWWNRERYKDAKTDAIGIDAEILNGIKSGEHDFEKYSDEHFALLNDQLAKLYPDLPLYDLEGQRHAGEESDVNDRDSGGRDRRPSPQQNGRRAPAPGTRGSRQNGRRQENEADLARQGKVVLSNEDFQQMRLYGLDPRNAEHKKRFAKERMRTVLTDEQRRGARS